MTHVIADDAEAVAVAAELAAKFAREAALRDAGPILPRTELDELSDSAARHRELAIRERESAGTHQLS
ncbi:hypothetical protein ABT173_12820 [Streptomyces sp. NPDC001795]|uniref:hypothetical protein n=1 Tax=unclassified Streptomyces TaxID=2593676 RepID=UPI0033307D51